jgi:predicted O-methyltransferase YrrM
MSAVEWTSTAGFAVEGVRFALAEDAIGLDESLDPAEDLLVWKTAPAIGELADLLPRYRGANIFELGIFAGGSVALTAMLAAPRKLVAIDKLPASAPTLARFIEARELDHVVRPYYEVDQSDRERLRELVATEFGDEPLDVVYDDASHLYEPTRASFEELFPRLRAGGVYVIEDWTSEQGFLSILRAHEEGRGHPAQSAYVAALRDRLAAAVDDPSDEVRHPFARSLVDRGLGELIGVDEAPHEVSSFVPLIRLVHELVLVSVGRGDVVRSIRLSWNWAVIERGDGDPIGSSWLDDHLHDDFGVLAPRPPVSGRVDSRARGQK